MDAEYFKSTWTYLCKRVRLCSNAPRSAEKKDKQSNHTITNETVKTVINDITLHVLGSSKNYFNCGIQNDPQHIHSYALSLCNYCVVVYTQCEKQLFN